MRRGETQLIELKVENYYIEDNVRPTSTSRQKIPPHQLLPKDFVHSTSASQILQNNFSSSRGLINDPSTHSISSHQGWNNDSVISPSASVNVLSSRSNNKELEQQLRIPNVSSTIDVATQQHQIKPTFFDNRKKSHSISNNIIQQQHKSSPTICSILLKEEIKLSGVLNEKDKQILKREINENNQKQSKSPTLAWQKMNALMNGIGNHITKGQSSNSHSTNKLNSANNSNNDIKLNSNSFNNFNNTNGSNNMNNNNNTSSSHRSQNNTNNDIINNSNSHNNSNIRNENEKKIQDLSQNSSSKKNLNLTFAQQLKIQKQDIENTKHDSSFSLLNIYPQSNHKNLLASSLIPTIDESRKYYTLQYPLAMKDLEHNQYLQQLSYVPYQTTVNNSIPSQFNSIPVTTSPQIIPANQDYQTNILYNQQGCLSQTIKPVLQSKAISSILSNVSLGIINIPQQEASSEQGQQKQIENKSSFGIPNQSYSTINSKIKKEMNLVISNSKENKKGRDDKNGVNTQSNHQENQSSLTLNKVDDWNKQGNSFCGDQNESTQITKSRRNGISSQKNLIENQSMIKANILLKRKDLDKSDDNIKITSLKENKSLSQIELDLQKNETVINETIKPRSSPFSVMQTFNEEEIEAPLTHFQSSKDLLIEKIKERIEINKNQQVESNKDQRQEPFNTDTFQTSSKNQESASEIEFCNLLCEEVDIKTERKQSDLLSAFEQVNINPDEAFCQQSSKKYGTLNIETQSYCLPQINSFSTTKEEAQQQQPSIQLIDSYFPQISQFVPFSPLNASSKFQKELDEFLIQQEMEGNQKIFGSENLEYLVSREQDYAPDPYYLSKSKQMNLTSNMRAILLDWMMEVSEEFGLKRETFHIAVNLVDRYLSVQLHIKKREFQLVGVTAMYMASKLEEIFPPRIGDFVCSTNNGYTPEEINQTELSILQSLNFLINPPTRSMWGNWFMSQWDIYIATTELSENNQLVNEHSQSAGYLIQFKQPSESSYLLFREFCQLMDTCVLDTHTLQFHPRHILASLMYLVLAKSFGLLDTQTITEKVGEGILDFARDEEFNNIFNPFLQLSFGLNLVEILPSMYYVAIFFSIPTNTDLPSGAKQDQLFQGYYEDFLAFQTHNKDQLTMLQGKI